MCDGKINELFVWFVFVESSTMYTLYLMRGKPLQHEFRLPEDLVLRPATLFANRKAVKRQWVFPGRTEHELLRSMLSLCDSLLSHHPPGLFVSKTATSLGSSFLWRKGSTGERTEAGKIPTPIEKRDLRPVRATSPGRSRPLPKARNSDRQKHARRIPGWTGLTPCSLVGRAADRFDDRLATRLRLVHCEGALWS